jgi:2-C-methyl-D-erythritol 4-phosphate cytidylyltransferase
MTVVGIIPAAGSGERLGYGGPKAFVVCRGRPLLEWSLDVLRACCDRVVVAMPPGTHLVGSDMVHGGATRSESVRLALEAAPEATVAVVHDAARPLVTPELVRECIDGLSGYEAAIAAAPMTDTVKEALPGDGTVVRTLDRSVLWRIQTPQVFDAAALRRALDVDDAALAAATDDAMLIEAAGGRVRVIEAPADNIKVTRPVDLKLAEMLLTERKGGAF